MTEIPALCNRCGTLSRVPAQAIGMMAICPGCRDEFQVRAPILAPVSPPKTESVIPTVYPVAQPTDPGSGLLYGLSISAFLIPLAWLLLKAIGAREPVFTFGIPFAIAFAAGGLCFGMCLATAWSFATRLKAILSLLLIAWGLAAGFYFVSAESIEKVRKAVGLSTAQWLEFQPPQGPFTVLMPGVPRKEDVEIIRGWDLEAFRSADRKNATFAFTAAYGRPAAANDDAFFAAAKDGALAATNGIILNERVIALQGQPGREFTFKLADNATNRIVRVYRLGTRAVVQMAEGPFLPLDSSDVKRFFGSLHLKTGR